MQENIAIMYTGHKTYRGRDIMQGRAAGITRGHHIRIPEESLPMPKILQERLVRISEWTSDRSSTTRDKVTIEGARYVSSYNWLDRESPTILVPGTPAKWLPPGPKAKIRKDDGNYFRDPNGARYPRYPLEPAVASIFHTQPDFDSPSIDIFGCGSTVGSLLSFISGEKRTFRFGVELIGNSLFLVRKTNTPKELIDGVYGYGHNFLETYTAWDPAVRGSASHQRIITYTFGGLKCLIRSECDGYLPKKLSSSDANAKLHAESSPGSYGEIGAVHTAIESLRVNQSSADVNGDLVIQSNTSLVQKIPQEAIFDLKTRSIGRLGNVGVEDFLQRLYVNQTPNLILAFHEYGVFEEGRITMHDVHEELKEWENTHTAHLRRLRSILMTLRKLASQAEHARLEVRRTGSEALEVWTSPDDWKALPKKWRRRWTREEDGGKGDAELTSEGDEDDEEEDGGVASYLKF